jgi:hypothetical protein
MSATKMKEGAESQRESALWVAIRYADRFAVRSV